jgi:hypothetical protein
MLDIELRGLETAFPDENTNDGHGSWIEWRALKIYDKSAGQKVSEWFYAAACSPKYLIDNPKALSEEEKGQLLTQDTFDEKALETFVAEKFQALSFADWEEFYKEMSNTFMYED